MAWQPLPDTARERPRHETLAEAALGRRIALYVGVGLVGIVLGVALTRLPEIKPAAPYDPRFTEDRIGLRVACDGETRDRVKQLMGGQKAEEVHVHG